MSKRRINSLSAALGLEGEDTPVVDNAESDAALVESSSEVDATLDDTETALDTSDTLVSDAETVDNVGAIVEDSIESGEGLDETAAAVVQETIENIMRRHGMPRRHWPNFPSKESYSSRSSRIAASKQILVSLEKGVWESIKDGVMRVWETIRDFFVGLWRKMTDFEYRLLEKFKDLKAKAQKLKAATKSDPIELGAVEDYIGASGETVDLKDVKKDFDDFVKQVQGPEFKKIIEDVKKVLDKDEMAYGTTGTDKDFFNAFMKASDSFDEKKQTQADDGLDKAKLRSAFSNVNQNEDKEGKAKKINPTDSGTAVAACESAISLLRNKPMAQMNKISDNFFMHIFKTIKSFFTSDDNRKTSSGNKVSDAEGGIKNDSEDKDQKVTGKEIFSKAASAYKYIMYNNIKVYKETVSVYYDIVDDLVSEQGHDEPDEDKNRSIDDF